MNSNEIQGTVKAVILSIPISIYKTLSQKTKRKEKETPPKRKWRLCEAEDILQFTYLGLQKVPCFPTVGKWGMAVGRRPYSPYPYTSAVKDLLQR